MRCSTCEFSSPEGYGRVLRTERKHGNVGLKDLSDYISASKFKRNPDYYISNLLPGDLIEFDRGIYCHWAIYVGNGYVIHFSGLEPGEATKSYLRSKNSGRGFIQEELLTSVIDEDSFRVNNLSVQAGKRGLKCRNVYDILEDAHNYLGRRLEYHLFENNCEHLVTALKYGVKFSLQAEVQPEDVIATGVVVSAFAGVLAVVGVTLRALLRSQKS